MKKILLCLSAAILLYSCFTGKKNTGRNEEENEKYDSPMARDELAAEKIKDPALGYVPYDRLYAALTYTESMKSASRTYLPLVWQERGPVYDSVGPSNGNGRGGGTGSTAGGYTAGRTRAFLMDTLNDPTGNTVLAGGVAGGIWRCTNFLSAVPNWTPINDYFTNLAVSSICQDPTSPSTIYFATGEPTSNADAVFGKGIWKSTNGGLSFSFLSSTTTFIRNYKIACDNAGNVYLASRITTTPVAQPFGLVRSTDGGTTWVNITPTGLTSNNTCTDFEFTQSGKLVAAFGYVTGSATAQLNIRYTATPLTVTPATWTSATGFRTSGAGGVRTEMASSGETVYAVTINPAYNTDSCYRSIDGGLNWTKQNTTVLPAGLGSQQGWYNLSLAVNPANTDELISGGLDAYRSINGGANWTRITFWVSTLPYVHADHHYVQYWLRNGETRLIMATDGGIFYSTNNGSTFVDKNRNYGIKQFYAGAIHPAAGSPYLLAGAQDNGTHQLKNPGLSYSIEVTGGDGCFVHINQVNPNIQFGSYVYNQYRRTTNGGNTWQNVNFSGSVGLFVNPFDHDDVQNIMYCSNGPTSQIRRWINTNTANTNASLAFSAATLGSATISLTAFKVSPYTPNLLFFGTNNGRVFRLQNANTVVTADIDANTTNIGSASFPAGFVSCVTTGTDDNNLVVVFSNYGVSNVWVTTNGGTSWTAIDGNLPDMPIRWALFEPGDNNKIYLATEAGIYTTTNISGASTTWLPEPGYPSVRTDMIKMRTSDSTIVAATHGRGLFTAKIPPCINSAINSQPANTSVCQGSNATFTVAATGGTFTYQWQVSTDGGATYNDIPGATSATLVVPAVTVAMQGYRYRTRVDTYCTGLLTSTAGILTVDTGPAITAQPTTVTACQGNNVTFSVVSPTATSYQWQMFSNGTWNNIAGATSSTYTVSNVTIAMNTNTFRAIVSNACPNTSGNATLFVNTPPIITLHASRPPMLLPGQNLSITASGIPPGGTYVWLKNGIVMSGVTGNVLTNIDVNDIGTYSVRYTDLNGCVSVSSGLLVSGMMSGNLWVYPNPNTGQFQVRFYNQNPENATVIVYDSKGAKVFQKTVTTTIPYTQIDVDLGPLASSGTYVVELVNQGGNRVGAKPVVVRHN